LLDIWDSFSDLQPNRKGGAVVFRLEGKAQETVIEIGMLLYQVLESIAKIIPFARTVDN